MTSNGPQMCWQCGVRTDGAIACASCGAPQPLAPDGDLFAALGLPRRLAVDTTDLEARYHTAARAVHPDRHQTASERARMLSLDASATVNRAYRTLRDPVSRGRYWLSLHGSPLAEHGAKVSPALASEVFETQEKLAELRAAPARDVDTTRAEVRAIHDALAQRLDTLRAAVVEQYARWNGNGTEALATLRERLSEIAYLRTLLGDVEDALGEGLRGTDHRH